MFLPRGAHAETQTGNARFLRGYGPYTAAALALIYGTVLAMLTRSELLWFAAVIAVPLAAIPEGALRLGNPGARGLRGGPDGAARGPATL